MIILKNNYLKLCLKIPHCVDQYKNIEIHVLNVHFTFIIKSLRMFLPFREIRILVDKIRS